MNRIARLLAVASVLVAILSGHAFGYALLGQKWPAGDIPMNLQLSSNSHAFPLSDGSVSWNEVAQTALDAWSPYIDTVQFTSNTDAIVAKGRDRKNSVLFDSTLFGEKFGNGVLAVTLSYFSGSTNTEADVVFNTAYNWDSYRGPLQTTQDLLRVAEHEFGHVLGLDHPDQAGQTVSAIMNSTVSNLDGLTQDDINGAIALYGTPVGGNFQISTQASPANGGTTAGAGPYASGALATVTATPKANYTFFNWTQNGQVVSNSATYNFTVTQNRTLVANFKSVSYAIAVSASPANAGAANGGGNYAVGATAIVTAIPNPNYQFLNWTEGGTAVSDQAAYSFTVSGKRTLVANFQISQYTVTTAALPAEGGTASGGGDYPAGTRVTLTAVPQAHYRFVNWTSGGTEVSASPSYRFTVTENTTLTANFTPILCTIATSAFPTAGGAATGGGIYQSGTTATVTAIPDPNYRFVNWTQGGNVVSSSASYSFPVTGDAALTANFTAIYYTIATQAGIGGTATGGGNYQSGTVATVTATPASGYRFVNWTLNGEAVTRLFNAAFTVTGNATLQANFEPKPLTANYSLAWAYETDGENPANPPAMLINVGTVQFRQSGKKSKTVKLPITLPPGTAWTFSGALSASVDLAVTPKNRSAFSHWEYSEVDPLTNELTQRTSTEPSLHLDLEHHGDFVAVFGESPYADNAGLFTGVISDLANADQTLATYGNGKLPATGSIALTVAPTGLFTAKISAGGKAIKASGLIPASGEYEGTLATPFGPATLMFGLEEDGSVEGNLTYAQEANGSGEFLLGRALYGKTHPTPLAGSYTALFAPTGTTPGAPAGSGTAKITIQKTGAVTIAAKLADGTSVKAKSTLNSRNEAGVFAPLSSGKGFLVGTFVFEAAPTSDALGDFLWLRPASKATPRKPATPGFLEFLNGEARR